MTFTLSPLAVTSDSQGKHCHHLDIKGASNDYAGYEISITAVDVNIQNAAGYAKS